MFDTIIKILWPIDRHEVKKFLPMAFMMFFILMNYSMLRSIKDGFVVTDIGPEAVSFLKTYIVLPSAIIIMLLYSKLCNILHIRNVFYVMTSIFVVYFAIFCFVLYPNLDIIHPNASTIENLSIQFPNFKWFIKIGGHWSFATFYVMAELWGSVVNGLLFWQFANQITKTEEARRFYSMFGLIGNCALPVTSLIISNFLTTNIDLGFSSKYTPIFIITILNGIIVMLLYKWIQNNVLTDPSLYVEPKTKGAKSKPSLAESFKMILTSKYLGLITILVVMYGISLSLVEGVWKSKIHELCPTKEAYTLYMGHFQAIQGIGSIICMFVGANILRKLSWKAAALCTPIMTLVTGLMFFGFIVFDNLASEYMSIMMTGGALVAAVNVGMLQNVLSKATKYSLFDSSKEMTYIPLDNELKTKGKAAVEVIGSRFGKSGGGVIQSTCFMIIPTLTFDQATPYFACIFIVMTAIWMYAVNILNDEYSLKLQDGNVTK